MQDREALAKLIHRYLDDALGANEEAEFAASLENSADVRRQFVDEAFLNHDLHEVMREADIRSFIINGEDEASTLRDDKCAQSAPRRRHSVVFGGALATAVLIAVALWLPTLAMKGGTPSKTLTSPTVGQTVATQVNDPVESVGTVVQQRDCKWAEGGISWRSGDLLPPKTVLSLESGAAEVALENGVRLVLSGPCKVQLVDEMRGRVFHGSLTAKVPSTAHGYTLTTPSSKVIDLGTEFGVTVDQSGKSEIHVFKGEVISRWSGLDRGQGKSLRLHQNDGARFGLAKSETTLITADETRFVRDLAPRLRVEELPLLPVRKNLALWLAADRMVETDSSGGVQSWSDLLCEPSQTFQVAIQLEPKARPHLVPNAVNGRPAVRFDGIDDFLVTTPLETTDSQTIFAVLGLSNRRPAEGQVINYNGPPHRKLSTFPSTPGVLQINARIFDGGGLRLAGFVYSGEYNAPFALDSHARTSFPARSATLKAPIVLCYRYDPAANNAALHVNGKLVAEKTAPWPAGLTSRKVIGGHGFKDSRFLNADIAEIIIYNKSLPDDELKSVFRYLTDRYGNLSAKKAGNVN